MDHLLLMLLLQVSVTASERSFACRPTVIRPGNGLPYYEVQSEPMSYNDAEEACREMEAELLTIRNNSQMIKEPKRKWLSAKKRSWTHVTLDLALTYDTQLSKRSNDCTAVILEDKRLKARLCSEKHSTVCMNQDLGYCKGCIFEYRCYFTPDAYKESRHTFNESSVICQKESASLTAIFNQHQVKWLAHNFVRSFWTGYKYNISSVDYYWHDGSRVINAKWKLNKNMAGDCVVITESGEWEMSNCAEKEAFVCTLEVSYAKIKTTCKELEGECICYWKGSGPMTFNKAMEQCLSDGGTMFYTNTIRKSNFITGVWFGVSDGHTKGVFRGVDGSVLQNTGVVYGTVLSGCADNNDIIDCQLRRNFFCQSRIDELLYPCNKSSGCLRVVDYGEVKDLPYLYQGKSDLIIRNVESLEICWDLCVTYIGFECLAVSYDIKDKSCGLSATVSENWIPTKSGVSRKRTRRVADPESYCMEKVADYVNKEEAEAECAKYKSGWKVPIIRDHIMLEKLGNHTSRENQAWISAIFNTNGPLAFTTFDGEYITYSRWGKNIPNMIDSCVIVDGNNYWKAEVCTDQNTAVCFFNLTAACNNIPDIENGNHLYNPKIGKVNYSCNAGYFMPSKNITYVLITCDCNDNLNLTTVENCTEILCPDPPNVEGSTIIAEYNITKLGSIVTYQCNENFKLYQVGHVVEITKSFNKTCELDSGMVMAKWSGKYTCHRITCPKPNMIANATVIQHGNAINDNATYICNINHKINGSWLNKTNATCVKDDYLDGVWINVPTCVAITCPAPPAIDAATITFEPNHTAIGARITYRCNDGFLLQKDGIWVNDSIQFTETCQVDYKSLSGKWRGNFTCVEIICPEPNEIDHATRMIHGTRLGDAVTYACAANYRIHGTLTNETNSICEYNEQFESAWTNVPVCEEITCELTPEIHMTTILAGVNTTTIGATVTYQCNDGFMVQQAGPQRNYKKIFNITCEVDYATLTGKWNGNYTCVSSPRCPEPPEVLYSKVTVTDMYPGGIAFFTCDPGYIVVNNADSKELTTQGQSTCILDAKNETSAIWDNIPHCEVIPYERRVRQCPPAEDVVGGKLVYKDQFFYSEATYTADADHRFENGGTSRTSICQMGGRWSAKSPKLKRKMCSNLRVTGAALSNENIDVGTKIEIRCTDPMARMENGLTRVNVKCEESGMWSYLPRSCKVNRCGPFEYVEHGSMTDYNNTVGGYAVISCDLSYRFRDGTKTKRFQCLQTLVWQSAGRCLFNTCIKLLEPRFGTVSTKLALENTVVDIKCLPGYMFPDGEVAKQTTCDASFKWTAEVEDCQVISCPKPPDIANAKISSRNTIYNSTITYKCDEIYRMANGRRELTIRCGENGKWNQTSFSCARRCPPVPEVKQATPDTSLAVNGTIVTYTCHKGHVFVNNNSKISVSCNGEEWNITETSCSAVTCPVLNLTHADWTDSGNSFGDAVLITCHEGYQYNNSKRCVLKCKASAEWNGDTTGCRPISCGQPPEVLHAVRNHSKFNSLGAIVTYTCRSKYWFRRGVIQTSITCDKTGLWSYVPSKCIPITCPVVPIWNDKKANSTQRHVGAVVKVTSTKHAAEVTVLLISRCMLNGEWEPSLDEKLASFTPEPVEAEYSESIGVIALSIMLSVVAVIVISDLRKIMNDVKGIKRKRRRLTKTKTIKATK